MYGLVAVKDGNLDLSKSAGPYVVKEHSHDKLLLTVNKHWYSFTTAMPEQIEIKRPSDGKGSIGSFESDSWPNLISGSSLMTTATAEEIKHSGFKTWQRTLDKTFALFASKRFLESGGADFIKMFASHVDRSSLMTGLAGFTNAEQFFPRGYILSSEALPKAKSGKWSNKDPIRVLMMESPLLNPLRDHLPIAANQIGANLKVDTFPLPKLDEVAKRGDYDLLAISFAVADPNFEGAMSFFIERDPAFIKSTTGSEDFAAQMREARKLPTTDERAAAMRTIIFKAQEAGHFLPLFHFCSFAIAKAGVDLSEIPNTDETVLFSKVRMK
jgi:MarR-like DNA-binding transcriptional regulator SgrR of sgrS sRNA